MRRRTAIAVLLAASGACAVSSPTQRLRPLAGEAEVVLYLQPRSRDAARLSFTIASVTLRSEEGGEVALPVSLEVVKGAIDGSERGQQLVARGRVPPDRYGAVLLVVASATLAGDQDRSRLLVPDEPIRAEVHFTVRSGEAQVLFLALNAPESLRDAYRFAPVFSATLAPQTPPQVALYCTDAAGAAVTVTDRRARLTTGHVPTGAVPRGIALDRSATRAFVALGAEDQIEIIDAASNGAVDRFRLAAGDEPRDVALAGDGATLLVVNERSRTLAFLDLPGGNEVGRVTVGDGPVMLLIDRPGRRAYVVNRGAATVTVVDVVARSVVATLTTDPEPIWAQLSRDGSRLYVLHRGSAYLAVYAVPALTPQTRAYVGLGAATLRVDPRTDLLYLARRDEGVIDVYDPISLQPVDRFAIPEPAARLAVDDVDNTLLVLMPTRRAIAVLDLTSRQVLAELPVGEDAYAFVFAGERF